MTGRELFSRLVALAAARVADAANSLKAARIATKWPKRRPLYLQLAPEIIKTKFRKRLWKGPGGEMEAGGSTSPTQDLSESTQLLPVPAPASPPPSYEHVLAESRIEAEEGEAEGSQERPEKPKEIVIVHKSSKELYKALAAQLGITCKMSDHCRCYECQSHYFDCEYDRDNEQEKTDGGLGAGTPMFISEVMHGTACSIL